MKEDRLRRFLLSSQPMCFNLFGQLQAEQRREALLPWVRRVSPGAVRVTRVEIEWAPPAEDHFRGGSAFDAFVEYDTLDGGRGFLGVECKYHEDLRKSDVPKVRDVYKSFTADSGLWREGAVEQLDRMGLRQFWLNTLLAQSLLAEDDRYSEGVCVVTACQADQSAHAHSRRCKLNSWRPPDWCGNHGNRSSPTSSDMTAGARASLSGTSTSLPFDTCLERAIRASNRKRPTDRFFASPHGRSVRPVRLQRLTDGAVTGRREPLFARGMDPGPGEAGGLHRHDRVPRSPACRWWFESERRVLALRERYPSGTVPEGRRRCVQLGAQRSSPAIHRPSPSSRSLPHFEHSVEAGAESSVSAVAFSPGCGAAQSDRFFDRIRREVPEVDFSVFSAAGSFAFVSWIVALSTASAACFGGALRCVSGHVARAHAR